MKKYRFELKPILEIRENIERQRQAELAEIRHVLRRNINALENLYSIKENAQREFLNIQNKSEQPQKSFSTANECIQYYEYLCWLEKKIDEQSQHIEKIRKEEKIRRKRLEEASRNKAVIEEFKKQDYQEFCVRLNKFEQKTVDEMATISYNLKR